MAFKKSLQAIAAGLAVCGALHGNSFAQERTERKYPSVETAEDGSFTIPLPYGIPSLQNGDYDCNVNNLSLNCQKKIQRRSSFSFDDSKVTLARKQSCDSKTMCELNGADGRIGFKALFGYEGFVWAFGMEHQSIMAGLQTGEGGGGWGADIIGASYHVVTDFRFYFGENKNMFFALGSDHISDRLIEEDLNVKEFLYKNPRIKLVGFGPIDVVSAQFAHKMKSDKISIESRIGHYLYQTVPFYMLSALWDKSKQGNSYPSKWFLEEKVAYEFSDKWDIFGTFQSEFGGKSTPAILTAGIEKKFSPYPFGMRYYVGSNIGREEDALVKSRYGIDSNGTFTAFEVFGNFSFEK